MQRDPASAATATAMSAGRRQTHLEYYKRHGIAPVRYDLSDLDAHLERRESLYTALGLLPLTFEGSRVLEVAAGTGQNSLYVAACMPALLELLEPNPTAVERIESAYAAFDRPHTNPRVVPQMLEHYTPDDAFDIVLCENWLGTSDHERGLMRKLAGFLSDRGVLVVTVISPIGFVPNVLRRFSVPYLAPVDLPLEERTGRLVEAFEPHLKTMSAMTRSARDWVQDMMLNPAVFGICLSAPMVLDNLGEGFVVIRTYPAFVEDWRWFKSLHGTNRRMNEHFLEQYWGKCHNYLDSTAPTIPGDAARNQRLEAHALALLAAAEAHEDAHLHGRDASATVPPVVEAFQRFIDDVPAELASARSALEELLPFVETPSRMAPPAIASLNRFAKLFGRETSYVALTRR